MPQRELLFRIFLQNFISLGLSDSNKEPRIMPCSEEGIAILVANLFILHQTKPTVDLGKEFDESNPCMKCGRIKR